MVTNTWAGALPAGLTPASLTLPLVGVRGEVAWIIQSLKWRPFRVQRNDPAGPDRDSGHLGGWITDRLRRD